MNKLTLISEVVAISCVPLFFRQSKPIEHPKKPAIVKKVPTQSVVTHADKPTTTVPPHTNTQDKGGLSVSTPPPTQPTTPSIPSTPVNDNSTTQIIKNITFFGYPDNDPPGSAAIAYPKIHSVAGGTGTYADPLTFAAKQNGQFKPGDILYIPYIQKYVIMEDMCASCSTSHVDIWMPSNGSFNSKVLACENKHTATNKEIILNPASNLPVGPPLFDTITGTCL